MVLYAANLILHLQNTYLCITNLHFATESSLISLLSDSWYTLLVNLTFPPACPRTAKQNRVDSSVLPSILNCAKPAACPSIGCDTFLSTEYSCIAPTTRFCWRVESHKLEEQSLTVALRFIFPLSLTTLLPAWQRALKCMIKCCFIVTFKWIIKPKTMKPFLITLYGRWNYMCVVITKTCSTVRVRWHSMLLNCCTAVLQHITSMQLSI